jgi:hypothetical protein
MGSGHFDRSTFDTYATSRSYATKSAADVINTRGVIADFLPTNFKNGIRESRDSDDNPLSTPIIVGCDGTGSMGELAGVMIKEGLAKLLPEVYSRQPVTNPHVMLMVIGDAVAHDRVPVQATQFEADIRIVQQLEQLYVERGGGGNDSESYSLAWIVAALMTRHDAWEKRQKKGVIFTYGDECVSATIPAGRIKQLLGLDVESDISAQDALAMASQTYDCYHLIVEQGSFAATHLDMVRKSWTNLLGERAIPVADHTKMPEIITSILQIRGGADKATVVDSWSDATALVVKSAVANLTPASTSPSTGVVAL